MISTLLGVQKKKRKKKKAARKKCQKLHALSAVHAVFGIVGDGDDENTHTVNGRLYSMQLWHSTRFWSTIF